MPKNTAQKMTKAKKVEDEVGPQISIELSEIELETNFA